LINFTFVTVPSTGPVDQGNVNPFTTAPRSAWIMREADEWTKRAGFGVHQPFIEVAHTASCDQATETLQQVVSKRESLVTFEHVPKRIALVRFELIRWSETEPTYVDALDAWPTPPTSSARFGWRTRTSPRLECLH